MSISVKDSGKTGFMDVSDVVSMHVEGPIIGLGEERRFLIPISYCHHFVI